VNKDLCESLYFVRCCLCVGFWRPSWCRRCSVWTQWTWALWRKVSILFS